MGKNIIFDISHHQLSSKLDWEQAAKETAFCVIRVQYGSSLIDKEYKNHVANCKKYGIPFGHYAYGHFVSVADAKKEAQDFLNRIDKDAKFLVLDTEGDTVDSCGTKNVAEASQAFIDVCKQAGYKTGFYVSHNLYPLYGLDKVNCDFLWIPRYGNLPKYPCCLWQYTESGKVEWFGGTLDLNQINGDKDLAWFIGEEKVAPKPVAPESPIAPYVPVSNGVIAKVQVLVDDLNIRVAPDTKAAIARKANKGEIFDVYVNVNGWHNIGQANWVYAKDGQYLALVDTKYPNVLIKNGSTGNYVKMIQRVVGVNDDGVFGDGTEKAVISWQKKNGLSADGVVGKNTWEKMF